MILDRDETCSSRLSQAMQLRLISEGLTRNLYRSKNKGIKVLNYKKFPTKKYKHIDKAKNIRQVENYVTDSKKISKHSFLPFIQYDYKIEKWQPKDSNINTHKAIKNRNIMYAGHLDNYIYRFYSDCLNIRYNDYLKKEGLNDSIIAYRSNKPKQSNIDFSAEAINEIVRQKEAFIIIGDFTHFFDQINHLVLKENLQKVLNVKRLENDWYNIYKSVTKFGYYEKSTLENNVQNQETSNSTANNYSYFESVKLFREFQRKYPCNFNRNHYGIPQGLAISGIFSNISSIDFDKKMKEISDQNVGMYKRYSDDFILILPKSSSFSINKNKILELEDEIISLANLYGLELNKTKTGIYEYVDEKIYNVKTNKKTTLDYLGFIFNGKEVNIRGRSIYKYYRKAYQAIDYAKKVKKRKKLDQIPYKREIYRLYTDYGLYDNTYGNFISYAKRSQKIFDELSPQTNNMMENQIKNRDKKLLNHLNNE